VKKWGGPSKTTHRSAKRNSASATIDEPTPFASRGILHTEQCLWELRAPWPQGGEGCGTTLQPSNGRIGNEPGEIKDTVANGSYIYLIIQYWQRHPYKTLPSKHRGGSGGGGADGQRQGEKGIGREASVIIRGDN
jgi:hypothetical protein